MRNNLQHFEFIRNTTSGRVDVRYFGRRAIGWMLMIRKPRANLLAVLSVSMLLAALTDASPAAEVTPGVKRCAVLQSQLTAASKSKHIVFSSRVKSLEAQAQQFCSQGKTAQGNRAYVKALNALGIKPDLETEHALTGDLP